MSEVTEVATAEQERLDKIESLKSKVQGSSEQPTYQGTIVKGDLTKFPNDLPSQRGMVSIKLTESNKMFLITWENGASAYFAPSLLAMAGDDMFLEDSQGYQWPNFDDLGWDSKTKRPYRP